MISLFTCFFTESSAYLMEYLYGNLKDDVLILQNSPRISPVPSPPLPSNPGSPVSHPAPQPPNPDFPPASLYQHLQMLQLQQSQMTGNPAALYGQIAGSAGPGMTSCHEVVQTASGNPFLHRGNCFQGCTSTVPGTTVPGCVSPPSFTVEGQPIVSLQRTSPPLNYQSLHIIREDVNDSSTDRIQTDEEKMEHGWNQSPQMVNEDSVEKTDFERFKQKFSKNPRISITDTQGHIVPVSTHHCADEETMMTDDTVAFISSGKPCGVLHNFDPQRSGYSMDLAGNTSHCSGVSYQQSANVTNCQTFEALRSTLPLTNFLEGTEIKQPAFGMVGPSFPHSDMQALKHVDNDPAAYLRLLQKGSFDNSSMDFGGALNVSKSMDALQNELNTVQQQTCAFTRHTMSYLLQELQRAVESFGSEVAYCIAENRFVLGNQTVLLEIEVCQGEPERTLKFLKIAGDNSQYNKICNELLACLAL